jgi:hypothetical protein
MHELCHKIYITQHLFRNSPSAKFKLQSIYFHAGTEGRIEMADNFASK